MADEVKTIREQLKEILLGVWYEGRYEAGDPNADGTPITIEEALTQTTDIIEKEVIGENEKRKYDEDENECTTCGSYLEEREFMCLCQARNGLRREQRKKLKELK